MCGEKHHGMAQRAQSPATERAQDAAGQIGANIGRTWTGGEVIAGLFARWLLHVATGGEAERLHGAVMVHVPGAAAATCHAAVHASRFRPR